MASRTWLAIVLCCAVWFGYMKWFAPLPPPHTESAEPAETTTGTNSTSSATASSSAKPLGASPGFPGQVLRPITTQSVKTDKFDVAFSAPGGKISEVVLNGYREAISSDSPRISTVSPQLSPYSLATLFTAPELAPLSNKSYVGSQNESVVHFKNEVAGVSLQKEYRVAKDGYFIDSTYTFAFPKASRSDWGYLMVPIGGTSVKYDAKNPLDSWEVVAYQNESVVRKTLDKIKDGEEVLQGNTSWVGFGNRYFATAIINQSQLNPDVVLVRHSDFVGAYLRYPLQTKADQDRLAFSIKVYSGPKDYTDLSKVPGMKQLINYGTFSILAYPLLELLRFFNRFVHNYGIAIILLTLLVRIIFYPLSLKSFRSMRNMQKLQPQIAAIKEKYKDDVQRFNQEQMALFKTHNVNPLGGCLPMLVQMPVFFALYAVLGNSIELFHAPFFGWVHDLSAKDPLYIFPVLMGISMFVQQKMTPTAGMDPTQAKMMMLMPVIFSFIMISLPSGLTIYIFLSTLMGILQQVSMNRERKSAPQLVPVSPTGSAK